MADKELEPEDIELKVLDLAKSMEKVRSRQADKDDVVIDMHHARLNRLEILAKNLKPVFDAIPIENEQFEFAIVNGETPRLWIDMTSFVRMAGDGREFEFVKDTRMGRTILGRSSDVDAIGEQVSDYVAERLLERERMIEGDWVSMKAAFAEQVEEPATNIVDENDEPKSLNVKRHSLLKTFAWFLMGLLVGGAALLAIVWFDQFDVIVNWVVGLLPQ